MIFFFLFFLFTIFSPLSPFHYSASFLSLSFFLFLSHPISLYPYKDDISTSVTCTTVWNGSFVMRGKEGSKGEKENERERGKSKKGEREWEGERGKNKSLFLTIMITTMMIGDEISELEHLTNVSSLSFSLPTCPVPLHFSHSLFPSLYQPDCGWLKTEKYTNWKMYY